MSKTTTEIENLPSENLALRGDENIANIQFGKETDRTWEQYNLVTRDIEYAHCKTDFHAIIKDDKLVNIVGKYYRVLPNEEAVKIADKAARLAGLVPFHEFTGEWLQRMNKHVLYDSKHKHAIHALYASNTPYTVNGDKMHIGVGLHNSIDGTKAFGCGIFTFRRACSNMVLAGTKGWHMNFDQRATIDYVYHRHTSGLDPITGKLQTIILTIMDKAQDIIRSYNQMAQLTINKDLIDALSKSRLSDRVLPDYVKKPEEHATELKATTQWQTYNDITAAIWHNAKADIRTKENQFNNLHKIMPLQVAQ